MRKLIRKGINGLDFKNITGLLNPTELNVPATGISSDSLPTYLYIPYLDYLPNNSKKTKLKNLLKVLTRKNPVSFLN